MLAPAYVPAEGERLLEGHHPVTQQRVFNFLCLLYGSDVKRFHRTLVDVGYPPKTRASLCPQAWAMLNFGWWTQLKPHFRKAFKAEGTKEQENAHDKLIAETKAFAEKVGLDPHRAVAMVLFRAVALMDLGKIRGLWQRAPGAASVRVWQITSR
jgi:hypothetical protein